MYPSLAFFLTRLSVEEELSLLLCFLICVMSDDDRSNADPSQSAGGIPGGSQSTASNNLIIQELRSLKSSVNDSWDQISARADRLSETVHSSSATQRSTPAESGSRSWANWMRSPPPRQPAWSDNEEEDTRNGGDLVDLSEADHQLVKNSFLASMSNSKRHRLRNQFPTSTVPQTRCPRLDPVFKVSLAKAQDVKALDRKLARV